MALTVADTDILIDALRGREPARGLVAGLIQENRLATAAVSLFELRSGARSRSAREKVDRLLAALTVLPFDEKAARRAAELRERLERTGQGIGMADYLIAGTCMANASELLTRNRRHFERVTGLALHGARSDARHVDPDRL